MEKKYLYDNILIKYVYKNSIYTSSNKLIISFSAFSTKGNKPQYSYMRTLEGIDINQLFVLDDKNDRGSYYLGEYPDFQIEKATTSLIECILKTHDINKENVMCIGSSKGGWAALYYAIKLGLGYAVVGEPQIFLASYLLHAKAYDVLEYISGKSICNNEILDNILFDSAKARKAEGDNIPNILIHAGRNGYHYKEHIEPFLNYAKEMGIEIDTDLEDYSEHNDLIKYYPSLLINKIFSIFKELNNTLCIKSISVKQHSSKFICRIEHNNGVKFAWYVYLNGDIVFTRWYEDSEEFIYNANKVGKYKFIGFAADDKGNKLSMSTTVFDVIVSI